MSAAQSESSLVAAAEGGSLRSWKSKQSATPPSEDASKRSWRGGMKKESNLAATTTSSAGDESNALLLLQESCLGLESCLVVSDIVMSYVEVHMTALMKPKSTALSFVFDVLTHLLHVNQSTESISHVARVAELLILQFRGSLFLEQTGFVQSLTYRLLILFSSANGDVRGHASSLLALLLRENFLACKSGERLVLAATIAVNRLSDPSLKIPLNNQLFSESLENVHRTCSGFAIKDLEFQKLAEHLCSTVRQSWLYV